MFAVGNHYRRTDKDIADFKDLAHAKVNCNYNLRLQNISVP
jgi:hypothetical protein